MKSAWQKGYSGKIEFIIIVLLVVFILISFFVLRAINKAEEPSFFHAFLGIYLTLFPFTVPFTFYPIVCILRKRVPRKIVLDENDKNFTIEINRKNIKQISFENLGYALNGTTNLYSTLIIYEKVLIKGMVYDTTLHEESRYYFKKVIDFEAPALTFSWSIKDLNDISTKFEGLNISKITPQSKKPFLLRLLEK